MAKTTKATSSTGSTANLALGMKLAMRSRGKAAGSNQKTREHAVRLAGLIGDIKGFQAKLNKPITSKNMTSSANVVDEHRRLRELVSKRKTAAPVGRRKGVSRSAADGKTSQTRKARNPRRSGRGPGGSQGPQ